MMTENPLPSITFDQEVSAFSFRYGMNHTAQYSTVSHCMNRLLQSALLYGKLLKQFAVAIWCHATVA